MIQHNRSKEGFVETYIFPSQVLVDILPFRTLVLKREKSEERITLVKDQLYRAIYKETLEKEQRDHIDDPSYHVVRLGMMDHLIYLDTDKVGINLVTEPLRYYNSEIYMDHARLYSEEINNGYVRRDVLNVLTTCPVIRGNYEGDGAMDRGQEILSNLLTQDHFWEKSLEVENIFCPGKEHGLDDWASMLRNLEYYPEQPVAITEDVFWEIAEAVPPLVTGAMAYWDNNKSQQMHFIMHHCWGLYVEAEQCYVIVLPKDTIVTKTNLVPITIGQLLSIS